MSRYTAPENNQSQDWYAQSILNSRQQMVDWISSHFSDHDLFVTLTFKPDIAFDEAKRSLDVKHFLKRLNRKVFGKGIDRGRQLRCCPIFELNHSDGLHVHMVLERPADTSRLNSSFKQTVIDTWVAMDYTGIPVAQDIRDCYDVKRLLYYMTKQIRTDDKLQRIDTNNLYLGNG